MKVRMNAGDQNRTSAMAAPKSQQMKPEATDLDVTNETDETGTDETGSHRSRRDQLSFTSERELNANNRSHQEEPK